jgi:hypothetical protein
MARLRGSRGTSRRPSVTQTPPPLRYPKCDECGADAIHFSAIILDEHYATVRRCEEHLIPTKETP